MFSRIDSFIRLRSKQAIILTIAVGTFSALSDWLLAKDPIAISSSSSSSNLSPVRLALESAKSGNLNRYQEILNDAVKADPNNPLLRGHLGQVRVDKKWLPVEETWQQGEASAKITNYRKLRDRAPQTVTGQLELADHCKKVGLKDQERVHLFAVIDLDADNAAVRQRLGFQKVGDQWLMPSEIEANKKQATLVAKLHRENKTQLEALLKKLNTGALTRSEVVDKLLEKSDPAMIPSWELIFSSDSKEGALAVIEALQKMHAPEASLSLVRHAMLSPNADVKQIAIMALRTRDVYSYVPALLSELKSPWISSMQLQYFPDGRLFTSLSYFADGQSKQQLMTFDHTFNISGDKRVGVINSLQQSIASTQLQEIKVAETNKKIEDSNKAVMEVLSGATDQKKLDSPQEWWGWWEDVTETYTLEKKTVTLRTSTASELVGVKTPGQVSTEPNNRNLPPISATFSPGTSSLTPQRDLVTQMVRTELGITEIPRTHECLPAGTKVWSKTGKVDIDRIKPGDSVLTQNIKTGELTYKPVLRATVRPPEKLLSIQHENEIIRSTNGHPFWVIGKGWIRAEDIKSGMQIHTYNRPSTVIDVKPDEKLVKTFNLVVEGNHNYFVGERGILSHDVSPRDAIAVVVPGLEFAVTDTVLP